MNGNNINIIFILMAACIMHGFMAYFGYKRYPKESLLAQKWSHKL